MVCHVYAIFSQGVFRPLEPIALPEGSHVRLCVEEANSCIPKRATVYSPKLSRPEDAKDFVMEVRGFGDAAF